MNFKLGSINQIPGECLQSISHLVVFLIFDGFIKSIRFKGTCTHCIHHMVTLHFHIFLTVHVGATPRDMRQNGLR